MKIPISHVRALFPNRLVTRDYPSRVIRKRITGAKREKREGIGVNRLMFQPGEYLGISMSLGYDIGSYDRVATTCQGRKVLSIKYTRKYEP